MRILKLLHPTFGICTQELITRANYEDKIKRKWAKKYGQKFKECTFEIFDNNPKDDLIKNLRTGEIYSDKYEAKRATGLSICWINQILGKQLSENSDYFLVWIENKAI